MLPLSRRRTHYVRAASALLTAVSLGYASTAATAQKPAPARAAVSAQVAFTAEAREIEDLKAVLATVRSKNVVEARVRTPGTVATLSVGEGDEVEPGQILGLVTDPKIALRLKASDAQIIALQSRLATAKVEYERVVELQRRGVSPQARVDQARTTFDVATNELSAARSERAVIERQAKEGEVLAPARGRVLRVPVTVGSVVLGGESIATIAANEFLLRLELPERHARFMRKGDRLRVGRRGLGPETGGESEGRIVQVYPEIQNGRVIADAEVTGLGDYFVGERALAWISAGKRTRIVVPQALTFNRFGIDHVRLASPSGPIDVVVQLGRSAGGDADGALVEVLAGLKPGDRLVKP